MKQNDSEKNTQSPPVPSNTINTSNIVTEHRLGRFTIRRDMILEHPHLVLNLLSRVLVTRCECLFHMDAFEYHGYSELFEPIERYSPPPTYGVTIVLTTTPTSVTPAESMFNGKGENCEQVIQESPDMG